MKVSAAAAIFSSPGEESALAEEMAQVGPCPRRMELSVHEDEAGAWAAASGFGTSPPSKRLQPGEREKERQKNNERFCSLVEREPKNLYIFVFNSQSHKFNHHSQNPSSRTERNSSKRWGGGNIYE